MKPIYLLMFLALVALLQSCYKEPVANFEYSYVDNLAPADVSFTNLSTEADKFQWDFGDGSTSSEENPEYAFYNWDSPMVSLLAKGRGGETRISKIIGLTSYYIRNSLDLTLYNTWSFYWDEENILDDFSLGSLAIGASSDVVITTHTIIYVNFDYNGTTYVTDPPFELDEHSSSYIDINGETMVSTVNGKKKSTLPQGGAQMATENNRKIKLKDLMAQ